VKELPQASIESRRPFRGRAFLLALVIILLVAGAPIYCGIVAETIAAANGCQVDEAAPQPCVIFGRDFGGLLYGLGVLPWLGIVTLPLGAAALIVWLLLLLIFILRALAGR